MRALLIGGGGREHAIGLSIVRSGAELNVLSPNRNPGLMRIAKKVIMGDERNRDWVLKKAIDVKPDFIFIGPEAPLAEGVSDALIKKKFRVFAPSSKAARLETSKSFCRSFLEKNHIKGNVESGTFSEAEKAEKFIKKLGHEFVIKPNGLTGGKGVMVQGIHFQRKEEGSRIIRSYLKSGDKKIVVEKKMVGEEFTLQAVVHEKEIHFFPSVQDYKRAYEGDMGPNTGGMGSICFSDNGLPFIPGGHEDEAKEILKSIIGKMYVAGTPYVGPIYGGFISTKNGPKLLEINARFGDPEAINVLSLMQNSLFDVAMKMFHKSKIDLEFRNRMSVLRYLAPEGYGYKPIPSRLTVDEESLILKGINIYYASVNESGNFLEQTTSRSLALLAEGETPREATKKFEDVSNFIKGKYAVRNDIGTEDQVWKKIEFMKALIAGRS